MKSPENPRGNERLCESGRKVGRGCKKEEEKPPPSLPAGGLNWAQGRLGGVAIRGRGQMHKANQERRRGSGWETPAGELRGLALWLLGRDEGIGSKRGGKGGWKRRGGDPEVEGREEARIGPQAPNLAQPTFRLPAKCSTSLGPQPSVAHAGIPAHLFADTWSLRIGQSPGLQGRVCRTWRAGEATFVEHCCIPCSVKGASGNSRR